MKHMADSEDAAGHAYTITILLAEGRSDGLRLVAKSNWNGAGLICPRNRLYRSRGHSSQRIHAVLGVEAPCLGEE